MGQFDDLFDDGGDKVRANAALRFGIEAQPDTAARDQVLARRYGLPAAVIEQYRPDYEARAKVEDAAPTLEQSPKLRGWLAEDITRAKVVHDDLDNMGAIEGALKYLVSAPGAPRGGALSDIGRAARAVASGAPNFGAGAYGAAAAPFELVGLDSIGGWLRGQQKNAQGVAAGWMGMSPDAGMVEQSVLSGLQSAGQTLVTLPAGFVNGARVTGEQIMLGLMGLTTGGQSYGKARDAGLAPAQAIPYAVQDATAEIVTEKYLGAAGLLKNIKAGASAGKLFAYELGKEVPGEIGATLWQNFNEWANVNPDKSVGEFLAEQPEDVVRTVIATLVGGTTQIGAIKGLERVVSGAERRLQAAELADTTAQGFEQLHALAAASKVLQRDPDTFEAFVARAAENGPVQDVFISAQTMAQSGVAEQLAQISPSVAAQLAEATVAGGDIRIPVAEYAARIAPSEYAQSLVDHLKTEPGGFSRAEAQAYMQSHAEELQAEVERALTERQADDTFRASADAVKTEIQRQLGDAARFTGQVNDAYASAVSSFYAVTAAKLGITPEELFKQYPLRIQAEGVARQSYAQGGVTVTADEDGEAVYSITAHDEGRAFVSAEANPDGTYSITESGVPENERGQGLGVRLYEALLGEAFRRGASFVTSDSSVSADAQRMYQALSRRGFVVEQLPGAAIDPETGALEAEGPVFKVSQAQQLNQSPVQATRNLIVAHNLSADNLRHALEIGGLPAPSLAITKVDSPIQGFGEITLIGDAKLATPGAKNPVFDADVYSPRFPGVKVKVDTKKVQAALNPLRDAAQAAGVYVMEPERVVEELARNQVGRAVGDVVYDTGMRYGYATTVLGLKVDVSIKEVAPPAVSKAGGTLFEQSPLRELLPTLDLGQMTPKTSGDLGQKVYAALVNKTLADMGAEANTAGGFEKAMGLVNRRIQLFAESQIEPGSVEFAPDKIGLMTSKGLYALYNLARSANASEVAQPAQARKEVDALALSKQLDEVVDAEQMRAWVRQQLEPALGEKRIVKDGGRTVDYTLDNLVKEMTKKVRDAEGFNYGLGNARSKGATKFKNLKAVQDRRDQVQPKADADAAIKANEKRFRELTDKFAQFYPGEKERYGRKTWEVLPEVVGESYTLGTERALAENGFKNVPAGLVEELKQFAADLVNLPTEYFEAKPQRAVKVDEFKGALIPSNAPADVRAALVELGLPVVEYTKGDEADRARAAQELAGQLDAARGDVLFQSAFHGTPHRGIEKFSTDKIGTGEGAQAYGWGLYFASKREIAEWYREVLTERQLVGDGWDERDAITFAGVSHKDAAGLKKLSGNPSRGSILKAIAAAQQEGFKSAWFPPLQKTPALLSASEGAFQVSRFFALRRGQRLSDEQVAKIEAVLGSLTDADVKQLHTGQLYEVEIPEDSEMLLWDKPLSEQPAAVRKQIEDLQSIGSLKNVGDLTPGHMIYNSLKGETEDQTGKQASLTLASLGIKGIKYLDGTSRGAGDGSFNYVIFSGDDVQITNQFYQRNDANRGAFNPATNTITLLKNADLSTFLHEAGHFFLETQLDIAARLGGRRTDGALADASEADNLPVGSWVRLPYPDMRGTPVAQVREVNIDELYLPELDEAGNLQPEKRSYLDAYTERAKAGEMAPNITVVEMEDGRLRVVDGHRRVMAARAAGKTSIRATVSPLMDHADGRVPMTADAIPAQRSGLSTGEQQILDDTNALLKWFGIESIAEWHSLDFEEKRSYHERFARGFEAYLFEGRAPNIELQGLFQRFRAWLLNVYRDLKNLNVELTDEVRGVMDRMLATTEEIKLAEQARSMMPLFAAPDQAGMTTEEFAAYQDLGTQATADAIQDLQARGMRDMQWLHNAKGREVKRLQRLSADLRREVQMDVRREVMSQPVYRAWQFLTGKLTAEDKLAAPAPRKSDPNVVDETIDSLHTAIAKLGGLRKDEVVAQWGVDPKDKPVSGVFGKPVLRREGGLSIDAMAERLGELGYLPLDENGKTDIRDLEERFDEELRGSPVYSIAHDYSQAQGEQRAGDGVNVAALTAGRLDLVDLQQVLLAGRPAPEPAQRGLLDGELGQGGVLPTTIDVDGQQRPTTNSKGQPIAATEEGVRNFWRWFGESKVVDEQGRPLVVYHGSKADTGPRFAPRKSRIAGAFFFAADPQFANSPAYTGYEGQAGNVTPAYLSFTNPKVLDTLAPNPMTEAAVIQSAREEGFDGVVVKSDGRFVAVEPTQIKSATGNRGTFDPRKSSILNQSPKNQPPVARDATTEQIVERLVSLGMTRKTGGLHPDIVAERFGFASGEEMVRALAEAQPPKAEIEALTDARMLEQHGELASPEAIDRAADKALHNDARQRFVATELAALEKATGKTRTLTTAAKQFAEAMVSRLRVRDIRPAQYSSAEARAAKLAQKAAKANDLATAAAEKRNQLVNGYAAKAAHAAQEEVAKIDAFFKRIANGKDDPSRDADIVAAARAVLATFGYGGKAKSAAEYLRAVREYDPALAEVLAGSVEAAQALADQTQRGAPTIEDLPLERLRALNDEIASLWHLAKRNRQMEVDGDMLDRQEIAEQLNARLVELGLPESMPGGVQAVTPEEQRAMNFASARAIGRRVESWVDRLDGSAKMGAFRRFLWTPIKEAADRYRADKAAYLREFRQAFDRIAPTMKAGLISAPELGYTFGKDSGGVALNEILHAMLHTGNASNKRKLLLGRGWAEEGPDGTLDTSRWDAFIARMVADGRIRREHFDFVQATWDLLERTKPLAQRAHRDAYGKYFAEVTAEPFTDPFGVQRAGGYAPAQVDSRIVKDNELKKLVEEGKEGMAYTFPGTTKGFTKSRVEYNRPLMLDLRTLPQHIDKVLLFGHLEMPVRDAAKLLASKGLAQSLNRADPAAITAMLMPWLNRTARQQVTTPIVGAGWMMRMLNTLRTRTSMATMFANVSNTMQQVTGFMLAGLKVPGRAMLASAADYMRAPRQTAEEVAELSVYMRNRMDNEVSAMLGEIDAILLDPSLYQRAQAWTTRHTFFMQSAVDNVMGPIIWKAAYNDALEQNFDPRDAVRIADAAVRQTQGSTLPEDVSRIETGPAYARLFTQFAGYFNMQANLLGTEFAKVSQEMGLRKGMGRGFFILVLGFYAPALVAEAIAQAFRGGPGDEDKDGEYLDDWLMSLFVYGPMRNITAFVPFVGAAVNSAVARFNDNPVDDRVSVAPVVGAIEGAAGAPAGLYKAATDEAKAQRVVKDVATLVTITTGLPASVAARPVSYLAGVAQGKVQPTDTLDAARGLLTGAASPESRQP